MERRNSAGPSVPTCQGPGPPLVLDRNVTGPLLSGGGVVVPRIYSAGSGFDSQLQHLPAMMMILGWGLNLPELGFLICKMGLVRMNGKIPKALSPLPEAK